jgi:hypothetical protein
MLVPSEVSAEKVYDQVCTVTTARGSILFFVTVLFVHLVLKRSLVL